MSIVIDGTLGVSAVQDGVVSESKLATGAVTDTKLTLTPNSQEIKDALNATGSAPIYACRAWVNFNGTGTVAIRASGNVSSITDLGTGYYQINFTTAMPDANYDISAIAGVNNLASLICYLRLTGDSQGGLDPIQSSFILGITGRQDTFTAVDASHVSVAIFR